MTTEWPASLWGSPWLRHLDERGRDALVAAGRVRTFERGERVFAAGQPADALFVVASGLVEVRAVRRGDAVETPLRRVVAGDAVGEEAVARSGTAHTSEAACVTPSVVAKFPASVFRRVAERCADGSAMRATLERLEAAATLDALRASTLARLATDAALVELAHSVRRRELARGELLFAEGDGGSEVFVVERGMLQIEATGDEGARIRAYLGQGDLVASDDHPDSAVRASGAACVLVPSREALLRSGVRPDAIARASRVGAAEIVPAETRHVLGDLWRYAVAGSMLVIDDDVCVRCGHCAWSCATAHGDGVSRLVRRGEKIAVRDATDGSLHALVVPGGCHQCKHPACMPVCPTGAIGRDAHGQVFIREELCVGCGQCERACPWGSVQMIDRAPTGKARLPLAASTRVATKCDACRDIAGGPACVRSCPVDAIARIEPLAAMVDVRRALDQRKARRPLPRPRPGWPYVLGAVALTTAVARIPVHRGAESLVTGIVAGALILFLVGYAVVKRVLLPRLWPSSTARPHAVAHLGVGVLAVGAVAAHAGGHIHPNGAGALAVAFVLASLTGALAAIAYRFVPRALARVERQGRLLEDLSDRSEELDGRTFGALSGRSDATKEAFARMLAPYARAPFAGSRLLLAGRTLREEERRVKQRVASEKDRTRLDGLDDLVRLAVERRAVGAQRLAQGLLRAVVPVHVVAVAVAVVLLVAHVAHALGLR